MKNRIAYADDELDEVVTDGGAHLERMGERTWFLECSRSDGSSFVVWIEGAVTVEGERPAPDADA